MSRQFDHEAHRVAYADNRHPKAATIAAGMELAALLLDSLVCAWPADSLVEVDAKLALADGRGPYGTDQDADYVASLAAKTARRIRIMRAAFHVGELTVPPAPAAPGLADSNLSSWKRLRYDLRDLLPVRGGEPVLPTSPDMWIAFAAKVRSSAGCASGSSACSRPRSGCSTSRVPTRRARAASCGLRPRVRGS